STLPSGLGAGGACVQEDPFAVLYFNREVDGLFGKLTRVERRLTDGELINGQPRYASSAFSCADTCGDYWVTTSETAYEWHPERDEFGRAVLQRFGSDLDTQTGAFVCASGPTPDADPLTNDFATSLPPFSFEKMTPAQLASRYPEIESAAAGAMGSPALDG